MIEWIRIKNFKSLVDTGQVEIRPLTLIMGPNSSGKSSIIQPLLVMRQTVDSRDVERPIIFDGSYVNLGPFNSFVYKHERRSISISFQLATRKNFLTALARKSLGLVPEKQRSIMTVVKAECKISAAQQMRVYIEEAKYLITDRFGTEMTFVTTRGPRGKVVTEVTIAGKTARYSPGREAKFYDMMPTTDAISSFRTDLRGKPRERWEMFDVVRRASQALKAAIEEEFSRVYYIGPLREEPWPVYIGSGERPQDVGTRGEDAGQVLFFSKFDRKLLNVRKQVAKWMEEFKIGSSFDVKRLEGASYYLAMKDARTSAKVRLSDVGFGASQLLPLIVEGYFVPANSTIIAEQPEIHLHPQAQMTLADLLIDIANIPGRKIIVETHSEHMLTRIQRRIAQGMINSSDVALYYCDSGSRGTDVRRIGLSERGQFEPQGLPPDFFTEGYEESKAFVEDLATVMRKKKRQEHD